MIGEAVSALEKYLLAHGGPEALAALKAKKYGTAAYHGAKLAGGGALDLAKEYPKMAAGLGGLGGGYMLGKQGQEQTEGNPEAQLRQFYGYGL